MRSSPDLRLHALAFVYDHMIDLAAWIRELRPGQLQDMAKVMVRWHATLDRSCEIVPLAETEKREIMRAISLCDGDIAKAAKALNVGQTTVYRKMREWGYSTENRVLARQAVALFQLRNRNSRPF